METALLKTKDDMDMALDRGNGILMVLLDLSAAVHHILLGRLKHTCGLIDKVHQWLASYTLVAEHNRLRLESHSLS